MLKGLPASGKSTRAKEIVAQGEWIRVNRDLLREMLHFDKWSGRKEHMTVQAEKSIVVAALERGVNVVIDDTNLMQKHEDMWRVIANAFDAKFSVEFFDTPVEECVLRDITRPKSVGRSVIVNMALKSGLYPKPYKPFVLCDLDGTLCDLTHRLKYAKGPEKDWKKFFELIPLDTPRWEVVEMVRQFKEQGHPIIFVSARPEEYREVTEQWIGNTFNWVRQHETLIMRKNHDKREDSIVKQEILDTYFKGYEVEAVIDDRPRVIRMWKSNLIRVIDVGSGEEF